MHFATMVLLCLNLHFSQQILAADDQLESLPLHLRASGQKVLVIAGPGDGEHEFKGIVEVLRQYRIPYERSTSFDKNRRNYKNIFAIISGSNRVDYFGSAENKGDDAFEHLDKFIREGGHLFCFGSFNGRNFHQLKRYGFLTSGRHGFNVDRNPPFTDVLFHGFEEQIPEGMKIHLTGELGIRGPHIVMLKQGARPNRGIPALITVPAQSGRVSVIMIEPYYKNSMWILPIATHWIARGAPTTLEQLEQNPVVDPFTLRERRLWNMERMSEDRLQELQSRIPKSLTADLLMARASDAEEKEVQFVALLMAADKYSLDPNADAAIGALLSAGKLYWVDLVEEQARLLKQCAKFVVEKGEAEEIARLALNAYENANDIYHIENAWELANTAASMAKLSGNQHFQKLASQAILTTGPIYKSWLQVSHAIKELKADPDNPQLNAKVGKFFAFVADDWDIGLGCLANGSNEDLQELAMLSQSPSDSPLDKLRLADRWLRYSASLEGQERVNVERKIRQWYAEIHNNLSEFSVQDQNRVERYLDQAPKQPAILSIRMTLDGYGYLKIRHGEMTWETVSGIEPVSIRIDDQIWSSIASTNLQNSGATRYMPNDVDFRNVNVTKDYGRGVVRIEERSDEEVVIRINDVQSGRGDYQFSISFGDSY